MSISVCNTVGCPDLTENRMCAPHTKPTYVRRPPGSTTERGYGAEWQRVRAKYFRADDQCVQCSFRKAQDLDHIVALEDGGTHNPSNLQPLCRKCHKVKTVSDTAKRAAK